MLTSKAVNGQGRVATSPRADGSLSGSVKFLKVGRRGDHGFDGAVGSIWRAEHAVRKRQGRVDSTAGQDRRLRRADVVGSSDNVPVCDITTE